MWTNELQDFDTVHPKLQNLSFSEFDNNHKRFISSTIF